MSRSVSVPGGAAWRIYLCPSRVGETGESFGEMQEEWEEFIEALRDVLCAVYPSLSVCGKWIGGEDRAMLENGHGYIGLSEYNGIVALWCVPKDGVYMGGRDMTPLAIQWCEQIHERVKSIMDSDWPGQRLTSQGTASNGEQFFVLAGEPGSCVTSKEGRLW